MTDRRSGPPLFDLMRERGEHPSAPVPSSQPPERVKSPTSAPKPPVPGAGSSDGPRVSTQKTAWDTSGGVSRAERSAAAMLDEETPRDTGIRLSSPMFYTLIVIAIAMIVGAWTLGYRSGNQAGKEEMSQLVGDQPVVTPPVTQPETSEPGSGMITEPVDENEPAAQPQSPHNTTPQATQGGIMSPSGFLSEDPREHGLNYLVLATLNTEQAADAISFLYSNGITVIGVPAVDSRGSRANNPTRYTLYSLGVAIPGNQWSAMSQARMQHQQRIADLGARWQRERRGASDFSQTNWEKYD
ncbi:MAG: hypothetical protein ACWA5W_04295 [Phycisphaerales bacterium]